MRVAADVFEHVVVDEEIDDLQLRDLGDHVVEVARDFPQLPEPRLVVLRPQLLQHLQRIVLLRTAPRPQPFSQGRGVALLQTALVLPYFSVLIEQVDLLLDDGDLAIDDSVDSGLRLSDIDRPQKLCLFEQAGWRPSESLESVGCGHAGCAESVGAVHHSLNNLNMSSNQAFSSILSMNFSYFT